jgi:peptidoglycan/LPS O-acetylase OafA/YrhL
VAALARSEADAPDAVAPPPHHPRFPLFDGLRAIAVLLVFMVHAVAIDPSSPFARLFVHMNFGVTLFFLISGFLLYRPFIAHRTGGGAAPPVPTYFKRRALRIIPAYWACLTVVLLIPGAIDLSAPNVAAMFGLVHTLPVSGDGSCAIAFGQCELAHTWSLGVEATFYVILPLYVLAADRIASGRRAADWVRIELALLGGLSLVALIARYAVFQGDLTSITGGTALGFTFWFALGMGMAVLSVGERATDGESRFVAQIRRHPGVLWLGAIALYVGLAAYLPPSPFIAGEGRQALAFVVFGVAALLLLLPAAFADDGGGVPRRLLATRVLRWLGLISYGLFLWHNVVIQEIARRIGPLDDVPMVLLALAISIAIAAASYYVIERPFLRLKNRPLLRRSRDPASPAPS